MKKSTGDTEVPLGERRLEADIRLREAELALRREELDWRMQIEQSTAKRNVTPTLLALIAAGSAIVGSLMGSLTQTFIEREKIDLETRKMQSSLIINAVKTADPEVAANNLLFLIEIGVLPDHTGNLRELLRSPDLQRKIKLPTGKTPPAAPK